MRIYVRVGGNGPRTGSYHVNFGDTVGLLFGMIIIMLISRSCQQMAQVKGKN